MSALGTMTGKGGDTMDRVPKTEKKVLFGYEIQGCIGIGAASVVYAVNDPSNGQLYALKHVVVHTEKDLRYVEQLKTELEVGKKVKHRSLRKSVVIKDHHTMLTRAVTEAVLLMEFADGEPIAMPSIGKLRSVLKNFVEAADALESLHQLGYVHCDLKPDNILVNLHGEGIKIIDFGQACPAYTVKSRIQGSPFFISPEQLRCEPVTSRTDVYNLGASLYRVLTGLHFLTDYLRKHKDPTHAAMASTQAPHEIDPRIPANVSNLVMECLQSSAANRPEMRAFTMELKRVIAEMK